MTTKLRLVSTFSVWCPECHNHWQSESYLNYNEVCTDCLFKEEYMREPKIPKRKPKKRTDEST